MGQKSPQLGFCMIKKIDQELGLAIFNILWLFLRMEIERSGVKP